MFSFGANFGMTRQGFGSFLRDLFWYDGGNGHNGNGDNNNSDSRNESEEIEAALIGNLPTALPSPFEPQSETVVGTAIFGIESVEDKSHSRHYDRSRYSARHSTVSGSDQYELVISTTEELQNTNATSASHTKRKSKLTQNEKNSNNNSSNYDKSDNIANTHEPDEDEDNSEHNISNDMNSANEENEQDVNKTNIDDDDDDDDDNNNKETMLTTSRKRNKCRSWNKAHSSNDNEECEEEEEEQQEQQQQRNRTDRWGHAKEVATKHSLPLLITVTSSANTDSEQGLSTTTTTNNNNTSDIINATNNISSRINNNIIHIFCNNNSSNNNISNNTTNNNDTITSNNVNTIVNNVNVNNEALHTHPLSSSLSLFSPLPVIPRFPSLSIMSDSNENHKSVCTHLQEETEDSNNNNVITNTISSNTIKNRTPIHTHTNTHEHKEQQRERAKQYRHIPSSSQLAEEQEEEEEEEEEEEQEEEELQSPSSDFLSYESPNANLSLSERTIPLHSWRSRMLGLCGLRPHLQHHEAMLRDTCNDLHPLHSNSNTSNELFESFANLRQNRDISNDTNNNKNKDDNGDQKVRRTEKVVDTHNVLNGGYVVFTDDYVKAHPNSTISMITAAYKALNDSDNAENGSKQAINLLEQNIKRSKLQEVRKCIAEVQDLQRPLFKRRNSKTVYGRASYHKRSNSSNGNSNTNSSTNFASEHHILVQSDKDENESEDSRHIKMYNKTFGDSNVIGSSIYENNITSNNNDNSNVTDNLNYNEERDYLLHNKDDNVNFV